MNKRIRKKKAKQTELARQHKHEELMRSLVDNPTFFADTFDNLCNALADICQGLSKAFENMSNEFRRE